MIVKPEQLLAKLQNQFPPVIWITGDETLLVQETCDNIRQMAREQGFTEREVYEASAQFDWNILLESANSLSLFADRKLIDLRLHSPKLDNQAKKALHEFVGNPGEDNVLLITSSKIEKATLGTKWFKAIESQGIVVQIWPINAQQLPAWISQRLKRVGLSADRDCVDIICQRVEGNLLAAAQEIDKLAILVNDKTLTPDIVARAVADNSRFNVFALTDASLAGNAGKALNILNHLQSEGDDPLKILFFLTREIRSLLRMQEKIRAGQNINGVMQSERVWQNRMQIVGNALQNHSAGKLEKMLVRSRLVDQSVKGLMTLKPWDELTDIILGLSNVTTAIDDQSPNLRTTA